jgi:hypothetical protein
VLVVDGEQLNDSSFIIKALSAKLDPGRGKGKAGKLTGQAAAEEEEWFRHALRACRLPAVRSVCAKLAHASRAQPQLGGRSLRARPNAKHLSHTC